MSRLYRTVARPAIAVAALAALLTVSQHVQAQDDDPADRSNASNAEKVAPADKPVATTLFILVRMTGEDHRTIEELELLMAQGATAADCLFDKPAEVDKISNALFHEIKIITSDSPGSVSPAQKGPIQMRELPTGNALWEFRLPRGDVALQELMVEYRSSGEHTYVPKKSNDLPVDLEMVLRGVYVLRMDGDDKPVRYVAKVKKLDPNKGTIETEYKGEWPAQDEYYSIKLRNFKGDRQLLFKTIKKPDDGSKPAIPNALDDVQLGQDTLFVIASLGSKLDRPVKVFDGNVYIARMGGVPTQRVDRVWMLFPLSDGNYREELQKYRDEGIKGLLPAIYKSMPSRVNAKTPNESVKITAAGGPQWYELVQQADTDFFERRIQLGEGVNDYRSLQQKYPRAWRLLVWEFNNKDDKSKDDKSKDDKSKDDKSKDDKSKDDPIRSPQAVQHPSGGRVYVLEEEIEVWPSGLRRLILEN